MESNHKLISDDETKTKEGLLSSNKIRPIQLSPSSVSVSSSSSTSSSSLPQPLLQSSPPKKSSKGVMHKIRSSITKVDSVIQAER